jgi:pimeloyl-ACP methyl ester carboxylesterase
MSIDTGKTSSATPPTIVLVHGAWHGGWCWERLTPLLEQAGYRVLTPTLAGLGARQAELSTQINMDTHVNEIAALVQAQPVPVVLLGHSYAGYVISGVADRLADSGKLRSLIYLDAFVPQDGERLADTRTPEDLAKMEASFATGNPAYAKIPAKFFGITNDADIAWVDAQLTDHPAGTYLQRIALKNKLPASLKRSYIACISPKLATIDASKERVRADASWRYVELATGHDCMVTEPAALSQLILSLA